MRHLIRSQYQVGGCLPMDSPTYVARQADKDLYEDLRAGEFCYILNSRQMGKSSLRVRAMAKLQAEGTRCAEIDIAMIGCEQVTPEEWYGGIINCLVSEFDLEVNEGTWWRGHSHLSPVQRLSMFIDEILLVELSQNIVIFIDEIDNVLSLNFLIDDFFALIRACFNKRAKKTAYQRLTFALIGVAAPSNLVQDKNRTPFNIGRSIQLDGFQLHEAQPLVKGLAGKVNNPQAVLQEVLTWTEGQPFLTQKLCHLISTSPSPDPIGSEVKWVENLVHSQVVENWEAQDEPEHLKTIRDRLFSKERLTIRMLALYQQTLQKNNVVADGSLEQMELLLSGLVVKQDRKLKVYNQIYESVFNPSWVEQELSNLRPYEESFRAWEASNRQDEAQLLRGQKLQDVLAWAADRSLSELDHQFLAVSQELNRREVRATLEAKIKAAKQILAEAQQKAKWQIRIGSTILAISLVGAVTAVGWIIRNSRIEQIDILNSTSENLLTSNQSLEGLIASVKAGRQLQKIIIPPSRLKVATVDTLQQIVNTTQEINRLEGHKDEVYGVSFSLDGQTIATASEDKTAKLWSRDGRDLEQSLRGHSERVWSVSFSPYNQKTIATTSWDGTIKLWSWDGKKSRELTTLTGHQGWVFGVSFSPNRQTLASVGADKMVRLWSWNGKQGKPQKSWYSGHTKYVVDVAFSPNGQIIATASDDGTVKLWNQNGTLLKTLEGHSDEVNGVSFSPNGQIIATASDDSTAKLWNQDGTLLKTLEGHSERVMSVGFSPDGQTIATASFDKTAKVWNLNGALLATLQGHDDWVWDASFSPDGQTIATASRDKTVRLWRLDNTKQQQLSNTNNLVVSGCGLLHDYLRNNPNVQQSDRSLCDDL